MARAARYPGRQVARRRMPPRQMRRSGPGYGVILLIGLLFCGASFAAVFVDWSRVSAFFSSFKSSETETAAVAPVDQKTRSFPPSGIVPTEMVEEDARDAILYLAGKAPPLIRVFSTTKNKAEVELGGTKLLLEPPKGYCFLEFSQMADAQMLKVLQQQHQGEVRMVAGFADCAQLEAWRADNKKVPTSYGNILTPFPLLKKITKGSNKPLVDMTCKILRENNGEFHGVKEVGLKDKLDEAMKQSTSNAIKMLGVIDQDKSACYVGTLLPIRAENEDPKIQINLSTVAVMGRKMLYMNLYSMLETDTTIQEMLARQKANIVRNVNANAS